MADTDYERLLTAAEVARLWGCDPKTISRWANTGKLPFVRTPGGQRRYPESRIKALLAASTQETR